MGKPDETLLTRLDALRDWLRDELDSAEPMPMRTAKIDAHLATVDDACEWIISPTPDAGGN